IPAPMMRMSASIAMRACLSGGLATVHPPPVGGTSEHFSSQRTALCSSADGKQWRTAMAETRWMLKGREFGNCNCAYGCPCQFNALPTYGHCYGLAVFD